MKMNPYIPFGLFAAALLAQPSCKQSSDTAAAARDVRESAEASTKETGEESTENIEAAKEVVKDNSNNIPKSTSGSAAVGAGARKLMEASYDASKQYVELMESITDKDSARAALAKFGDLGRKYDEIAAMAKSIGPAAVDPEDAMAMQKEMMERTQPIKERMEKATKSAVRIMSTESDLMTDFQAKAAALATKMTPIGGAP